MDKLESFNPNYLSILYKELKHNFFLIADKLLLEYSFKGETSNEGEETVYILKGNLGNENLILFTDLSTASYYVVEKYILPKLTKVVDNLILNISENDLEGINKDIFINSFYDYSIISYDFAFSLLKGVSNTPYGYIVGNERTIPVQLKEYMQAINYKLVLLPSEDNEGDPKKLYIFQV